MLDSVKTALRVSTDEASINEEIEELIESALTDLKASGIIVNIDNQDDNPPLVKRAVKVYAKAHFGFDNPEADRFLTVYDRLKVNLAIYGDHHEA